MWNLAHLHITINHVPVVLVPAALVIFAVAAWRKSLPVLRTGIVVAWVAALFAVASFLTGDAAADLVMATEKAQQKTLDPLVEAHDDSAAWALGASLLLAAAGVWGWRRKGLRNEVTVPLLVLSALGTAILARTAFLGGQIRHPEARPGFVAPAAGEREHEHEK
ncbi:MAG TPA: DUF2231 domain-containing protein [Myxococcaceae bacterium]|nr:DUF2231 domain-containing protein [Myxococcaceae bacterium]